MFVGRVKLLGMLQLTLAKNEDENDKSVAAGGLRGRFGRQTAAGPLNSDVVFDDLRNGRTRPGSSFFIRP